MKTMIKKIIVNHKIKYKIIVQTITRRVAAGGLVLPFQGERKNDRYH
ncbi:MAG: hypothetical protein LBG58_07040 [Planctomycetaceae bacterium]|jgi:hypothetical protein|nr:hypothetical protein [Planctomycetaceae bacterium]